MHLECTQDMPVQVQNVIKTAAGLNQLSCRIFAKHGTYPEHMWDTSGM